MKKILFLLTMLLCMVSATTFAHDIEVKNDDGVTIYYVWTNNKTELAVCYRGSSYYGYYDRYSGTVVIPASVTYNGSTYSVTSIAAFSFYGCFGMTSISIPSSITSIGDDAFNGCNNLTEVHISDLAAWCSISFAVHTSNPLINTANPLRFANHLFLNGSEVVDLVIPDGVISISENAFHRCLGLAAVYIPASVKYMGNDAFYGCLNLSSVHISDIYSWCKVLFESISSNPLSRAGHLYLDNDEVKKLIIPKGIQSIGNHTFYGCSGLESVIALPETPPLLYEYSFSNYNIPLYASKTAIEAYQATSPWSKFAQFLTLEGEEVEVPQCATPTIDYANWKLTFNCETEGAEIIHKVTCSDSQEGNEKSVSLTPTYTITAYAKAEGYRDSEVATATISWKDGRPVIIRGFNNVSLEEGEPICDVNNDGKVDVADIATIISAMASKSRK